jgi:hypothetical protein
MVNGWTGEIDETYLIWQVDGMCKWDIGLFMYLLELGLPAAASSYLKTLSSVV